MKKGHWVIVADSSLARIFECESQISMVEIEQLTHPESRLPSSQLVSDRPGREFPRMGGGSRSAIEPNVSPQEQEFKIFAKEIALFLKKAHSERKFVGVYLIAGPDFLGLLRAEIPKELASAVAGELTKNLTHLPPKEIIQHLLAV